MNELLRMSPVAGRAHLTHLGANRRTRARPASRSIVPACRCVRSVLPTCIAVFLLLVAIVLQGCSTAESRDDTVPDRRQPTFTLLSSTAADTLFTYTVDVQDSLAVFGRGRDLVVVDVAVPSELRMLGSITLAGPVRDVVLQGDHAFAAADSGGLHIIDLSNPKAPRAAGHMRFADRAYGVDVANGRAYLASRSEGLRILDVSDPAAPVEIGHIITPDEAVDVVVRGDFAYVAAWYASMRVIDVSDPAAPKEASFAAYDSYDNGAAWSVYVDGELGVQAVPDMGLRTVDVSDPRNAKLHRVYRGLFAPVGAALRGHTAFVADQDAGFRVLDLADPVKPVEIGSLDLSGPAMSIALSGDVAYVAARQAGLRIVDISRPYDPREIGHVDASDAVVDLALFGDTLIAAGIQNGITLHHPASPLETIAFLTAPATRVAVHGRTLLVGSTNAIRSYDRFKAAAPAATATMPGTVHGLAANDEVVIAAIEGFGLRLLASGTLDEVGSFEPERAGLASSDQVELHRTAVAAWDVLIDGRHAIGAFDDGIRFIDVSRASAPTLSSFMATPQRAYRLAVQGSHLFAACDDGLRAFDLSDPSNPTEIAYLKTPSFATALAMEGDRIYVGDLSGTITVASTSRSLERLAEVKVADRIHALAALETGIAVAAGAQGIRLVADLVSGHE